MPRKNSSKSSVSLNCETRLNNRSSACRNLILFGSGVIPANRCSTPKSLEFWLVFNTSMKLHRLGWWPLSTQYRALCAASAILLVLSLCVNTLLYWFHREIGNNGWPLAPISLNVFYSKKTSVMYVNHLFLFLEFMIETLNITLLLYSIKTITYFLYKCPST